MYLYVLFFGVDAVLIEMTEGYDGLIYVQTVHMDGSGLIFVLSSRYFGLASRIKYLQCSLKFDINCFLVCQLIRMISLAT